MHNSRWTVEQSVDWLVSFRTGLQSSSIDSQPSAPFPSPVSAPPSSSSSSDSLLSSPTPTNLSLISPSTGATLDANAFLTAGFVEVSYSSQKRD